MDEALLKKAGLDILQVNMNLQKGESVLFMTDIPSPADWQKMTAAALAEAGERSLMTKQIFEQVKGELPDNQIDFLAIAMTPQSGAEPGAEAAAKMLNYDVLVMMTTNSLSHTEAREHACRKGARVASMPGIEPAMFAAGGPMLADYKQVEQTTLKWAEAITPVQQVHVTTPYGTDLRFSIAGRDGHGDTGLIHQKGEFGNLPAGEAYTAPLEGTAEGTLAVPAGWFPNLSEKMVLTFEKGYVTKVEGGGKVGAEFAELFAFHDESLKHRRNCAELGIGTNPNAKRADNVLEAEKILGTIHIAVGDSSHVGGVTVSDLHEDFVQNDVVVEFDGRRVIG